MNFREIFRWFDCRLLEKYPEQSRHPTARLRGGAITAETARDRWQAQVLSSYCATPSTGASTFMLMFCFWGHGDGKEESFQHRSDLDDS